MLWPTAAEKGIELKLYMSSNTSVDTHSRSGCNARLFLFDD